MLKPFLLLLPLLWLAPAQAGEIDDLKQQLKQNLPDINFDSLQAVDDTGLYEAVINGEIIYFTADGRYVLQGELVSLESKTNLTEQRRVSLQKGIIDGLDEKDMIYFLRTIFGTGVRYFCNLAQIRGGNYLYGH